MEVRFYNVEENLKIVDKDIFADDYYSMPINLDELSLAKIEEISILLKRIFHFNPLVEEILISIETIYESSIILFSRHDNFVKELIKYKYF